MNNICGNCFKEKQSAFCPYCGFNEKENAEKYPLALPVGSILAGRYIVGKVIGQGGFGITYLAQEYDTKKKVAIKEYFPESLATRTQLTTVTSFSGEKEDSYYYGKSCFLEEAKTLAEFIGNPSIVRIYSYFEENNTAYFVMEHLEGTSLLDYVNNNGGKISWREMRRIADPIMDALGEVHSKGIVHRDISADNIFLCSDGSIKLIDFGAARYSLGDKSRSLDILLKHGYAPMEQYARHGRQGPFTDIYALAATMYRCVTGKLPPDSIDRIENDTIVPPSSYGVEITPAAEAALMQALAVNPASRFSNVLYFKKAMDSTINPTPKPVKNTPPAPPAAPVAPPAEPYKADKKSNAVIITSVVVASVVLIAGIIALFFILGGSSDNKDAETPATEATTINETVSVPDVVGDSESTAKRQLEDAGLTVTVKEENSSDVSEGYVISQSISGGVQVNKGSNITITVSLGTSRTEVPDVVGKSESEARSALESANLECEVEEEYSDTVDEGIVIRQSEYAGTEVDEDTTVTITVSKGVEDKGSKIVNSESEFREIYDNMQDYLGYTIAVDSIYIDKIAAGSHYDSDALWMGFPPEDGGTFTTFCVYNLDDVSTTDINDFVQQYVKVNIKIEKRDNLICMNLSSIWYAD